MKLYKYSVIQISRAGVFRNWSREYELGTFSNKKEAAKALRAKLNRGRLRSDSAKLIAYDLPVKDLDTQLEEIAKEHLDIPTLQSRGRDNLDFHEIGIARLKKALQAAYELGKSERKVR